MIVYTRCSILKVEDWGFPSFLYPNVTIPFSSISYVVDYLSSGRTTFWYRYGINCPNHNFAPLVVSSILSPRMKVEKEHPFLLRKVG